MKKAKLKKQMILQDKNTFDIDSIVVEGYNFREIYAEIKKMLCETGIKIQDKIHKWETLEEKRIKRKNN